MSETIAIDESKQGRGRPRNSRIIKLIRLAEEGWPIKYARFQQPIPAAPDKEPVNEFKTNAPPNSKYYVDSLIQTETMIIFSAHGTEYQTTPITNVAVTRP